MKKRTLRIAAVVAALVLAVMSLAGCALYQEDAPAETTTQAPGAPGATEEIPPLAATWPEFGERRTEKITWFEMGWTGMEKDLDIITPEIARRTNLYLEYEPMTVPTGDDYNQRLNLMIASRDVPNVFFGGIDSYTRTIYKKLGESGAIWDISEIIRDYENLYNLVYPELNLYRTEDGKNFFVPTQTGRGNEVLYEPPHGIFVRQDFLDKLGMEQPESLDEFKEYLRRSISEITIDGKPVTGLVLGENLAGLSALYEPFLPLLGQFESFTLPFNHRNHYRINNYLFTDSPELLDAAKFIHGMVKEGLLDREVLTIKHAQKQERISSGMAAAFVGAWWDMNTWSDNAKQVMPDLLYFTPPIFYQSEEIRASRSREWTNWVGCWSSIIVSKTVSEENLRHLLAVMDYFATEEGQLLAQAGIEGVTFEWNEEGKYEFTEEFKQKTNNLDWNKAAAYGVFYYSQLVFNVPVIRHLQQTPPALLREDNLKGWNNRQDVRDLYRADMDPPKDYYFLPGEIELQKMPAIRDAQTEFWAKVIAARSEEEVAELVAQWGRTTKNMGIDEIIAEREAFIDNLELAE